jgi:hypothetical protein
MTLTKMIVLEMIILTMTMMLEMMVMPMSKPLLKTPLSIFRDFRLCYGCTGSIASISVLNERMNTTQSVKPQQLSIAADEMFFELLHNPLNYHPAVGLQASAALHFTTTRSTTVLLHAHRCRSWRVREDVCTQQRSRAQL